jgi:hypothetical protein
MGPELVAAIIGPVLGGMISLGVWMNKKNSEFIMRGFERMGDSIQAVERKIDMVKYEMAKNYVTNEVLNTHIAGEETWHQHFNNELKEMHEDIREVRKTINKTL